MPAPIRSLWSDASALKRLLFVAGPLATVAVIVAVIVLMARDGGEKRVEAVAPTATATATATSTATPTETPLPTATPAPAPPPSSGGGGGTYRPPSGGGQVVQPQAGTGPGPVLGTGMSMTISKIGVNGAVSSRTVGTNGRMGDPIGAWMILWYDFSTYAPGYGGYPGEPGANAVFSGHVDYINVGPAVFWGIRNLQPGDQVTVHTPNGPITYAIEWSTWAGPRDDFSGHVAQTGQDVITLVTCIGSFSGGHYSDRLIVRGVRI